MTKLTILEYPDPRLRTRAAPIEVVNDDVRALADQMLTIMYDAPGIGLAATQVDRHVRMLVADVSEQRDEPHVLINPEVLSGEGEVTTEEGCLSIPDIYTKVTRHESISVRYTDRDGEPQELATDGMLAVCIQHEIDHLDGKLIVDYVSELKRRMIRKKLAKNRRSRA